MIKTAAPVADDKILFVAPADSYRLNAFVRTARDLGHKPVIVSTGSKTVITSNTPGIRVNLDDLERAAESVLRALAGTNICSVIATDDATVEIASIVAGRLGLPHNSVAATRCARRKNLGRACLVEQNLPVPRFKFIRILDESPIDIGEIGFPCVIKPIAMSASRGVIRVNNRNELKRACARVKRLLDREGIKPVDCLVEEFIPGQEVAVEGLLRRGRLSVLAIFDKPDALDGPYFEETYYITPSRHSDKLKQSVVETVQRSCHAYGLCEGPIHAECRINADGVWLLELATRTIGGECSQVFEHILHHTLEEQVIRNAMRQALTASNTGDAAGVLMLPVEQGGMLRRVEGVRAATEIEYIEQVIIDVRAGQEMIPWPEGGAYPGFILARAPTPEQVEAALRKAHANLNFVVAPKLPVDVAA